MFLLKKLIRLLINLMVKECKQSYSKWKRRDQMQKHNKIQKWLILIMLRKKT